MAKLRIYRFDASSCNGCDRQILETLVPRYKLAELGVEVVDYPHEANVLVVTGSVNVKSEPELRKAYEQIQEPKLVVAVGSCAISGGIYREGYTITGPVDRIIPVNLYVFGCPPRPQAISGAIAAALGVELSQVEPYWGVPEGFRGPPKVDGEKCIGCGACAISCSSQTIETRDEDAERLITYRYEACTYCGICERICPTEAVKLGTDYRLWFKSKEEAKSEATVELHRCSGCGTPYAATRHLEWAVDRVVEKVEPYREFRAELMDASSTCPSCRTTVGNIRRAKALLTNLTIKVL